MYCVGVNDQYSSKSIIGQSALKGLCLVIHLNQGFNYCFGYSKIKVIHFTLFYSQLDLPIAITC